MSIEKSWFGKEFWSNFDLFLMFEECLSDVKTPQF
jgi:hypothetical protein